MIEQMEHILFFPMQIHPRLITFFFFFLALLVQNFEATVIFHFVKHVFLEFVFVFGKNRDILFKFYLKEKTKTFYDGLIFICF